MRQTRPSALAPAEVRRQLVLRPRPPPEAPRTIQRGHCVLFVVVREHVAPRGFLPWERSADGILRINYFAHETASVFDPLARSHGRGQRCGLRVERGEVRRRELSAPPRLITPFPPPASWTAHGTAYKVHRLPLRCRGTRPADVRASDFDKCNVPGFPLGPPYHLQYGVTDSFRRQAGMSGRADRLCEAGSVINSVNAVVRKLEFRRNVHRLKVVWLRRRVRCMPHWGRRMPLSRTRSRTPGNALHSHGSNALRSLIDFLTLLSETDSCVGS